MHEVKDYDIKDNNNNNHDNHNVNYNEDINEENDDANDNDDDNDNEDDDVKTLLSNVDIKLHLGVIPWLLLLYLVGSPSPFSNPYHSEIFFFLSFFLFLFSS